jgi:hypothetical protein
MLPDRTRVDAWVLLDTLWYGATKSTWNRFHGTPRGGVAGRMT